MTETVELAAVLAKERPPLSHLLGRPGTRAVVLAGSKDPNAKVTVVLLDDYGPAFVIKVPTTPAAANVVRFEGDLLEALRDLGLAKLGITLPQPIGYLDAEGLPALVTTALTGTPLTVQYHAWRHTARRRAARADFTAAGAWLAQLQARTAGRRAPVTLLHDSLVTIGSRFRDHPGLPLLRRRLAGPAARLAEQATPRTVVHGDFWFGNLLTDERRPAEERVVGVVDWEAGTLLGEPLRDVARFAVSYALYLDRHVRPGRRVPGHRGMVADSWGAGLVHAAQGRGWFGGLIRQYLCAALERLGAPATLWPEVMLAGIADVAASADHPQFADRHVDLLLRLAVEPVGDTQQLVSS
jgi:hypothetical protein